MEPNGSMLQMESTSTFSRRIGANGPKGTKSNIPKREIGTVLILPKQSMDSIRADGYRRKSKPALIAA
jgi:hypothetical protein